MRSITYNCESNHLAHLYSKITWINYDNSISYSPRPSHGIIESSFKRFNKNKKNKPNLRAALIGTALIQVSPDFVLKRHCLNGAFSSSKIWRMQNPNPLSLLCLHNFLLKLHKGFPSSGERCMLLPKCIIALHHWTKWSIVAWCLLSFN